MRSRLDVILKKRPTSTFLDQCLPLKSSTHRISHNSKSIVIERFVYFVSFTHLKHKIPIWNMPIYSAFTMPSHAALTANSSQEILKGARELMPNRLFYTSLAYHPHQYPDVHFFSIDQILVYINFYSDFGPNNLAQVFRFCEMLVEKMKVRVTLYAKQSINHLTIIPYYRALHCIRKRSVSTREWRPTNGPTRPF